MTLATLQQALVDRISADLAGLARHETPLGGHRAPRVSAGWLGPKHERDASLDPPGNPGAVSDDFPFVLIRLANGQDATDGATATAQLIIGTYADDDDGHADVLTVLDTLRTSLLARPVLTMTTPRTGAVPRALPMALRLPLRWQVYDEQPRPYWAAEITTTWSLPRTERVDVEEMIR